MSTISGGWSGPSIIKDGLVLYLNAGSPNSYYGPFSGNTWKDISGFGNNGSLVNGVVYTPVDGGSFLFNGNASSANFGNILNMRLNSISYGCWVKINGTSTINGIFGKTSFRSNAGRYGLLIDNGSINAFISPTSSVSVIASTSVTPYIDNKWHYMFVTINRSDNMVLYIDTFAVSTQNVATYVNTDFNNSDILCIGSYVNNLGTSPLYSFNGNIALAKMYNRALSRDEIIHNYNVTKTKYGNLDTSLILYLDAGNPSSYTSGSTVWHDLSISSLNGNLLNGVSYNPANGGSLVFDGTNDYVDAIGTTSTFSFIQRTGVFTINAWVKCDVLNKAMYFIGNNDGTTLRNGFFLGKLNNSSFNFAITRGVGGQSTIIYSQTNFFTDTNWVNITITANGTNATVYKNDTFFSTSPNFSTLATSDSFRTLSIGRYNNTVSADYWDGEVAVIQIYDRSLTATEVNNSFQNYRSRYGL